MQPGSGLLIRPSSGVHTCGMRCVIDVVTLDKENCVLGIWSHVPPWRICGVSFRTRSVLELPPGTVHATQTLAGDQLCIECVNRAGPMTEHSP